ncbi:MAG: hypothetical protein WAU00_11145, partial [Caldilinea sp.]
MQRLTEFLQDPSPRNRRLRRLLEVALVSALLIIFIVVIAFQLGRSSGLSQAQQAAATAASMQVALASTFT